MKKRIVRYLLMLLVCGLCYTEAFAYEYTQGAQTKSWGYQPVYNTNVSAPNVSAPSFQFRTTSYYTVNPVEYTEANSRLLSNNGPRRSSPFDWDEEENAVGEVDDIVPIGDIPWWLMLLLSVGYIAFLSYRRRKA